jgi:hypothetical protein
MFARMTAKLIMNPVIIMNLDSARRSCPMMFPPLLRSGLSSVDRVPLAGRRAMLEATATEDPAIAGTIGCLIIRLVVQRAESLDYVLENDRSLPARSATQMRSSLHRAGVRGPRSENGPLFVERQIRIVDDVRWMVECLGGM